MLEAVVEDDLPLLNNLTDRTIEGTMTGTHLRVHLDEANLLVDTLLVLVNNVLSVATDARVTTTIVNHPRHQKTLITMSLNRQKMISA